MPNWEGSTRKDRLPADWPQLRIEILERDARRCQHVRADRGGRKCGQPANEVDHIIPGDDHSPSNLRALCHWHHLRKSGREGGTAAQDARRSREAANAYVHPALR